jgi:hypothetical protein
MTKQVTSTESKTRTPRTPRAKNDNLGSFVDVVTPEPRIILENFLNMDSLGEYLKKANTEQKAWVQQMIDITLSVAKQEEFLSLGEKIAMNTLRKMNILG